MALSDAQLRSLKPKDQPYRKGDGGGLFVEVRPNGSKLWRLAYRYDGKQRLLALGAYPTTSLPKARTKRHNAKTLWRTELIPPPRKNRTDRAARAERAHIWQDLRRTGDEGRERRAGG